MKLNVGAFALAFGLWWGAGVFILTWWFILTGAPAEAPGLLERLYVGYAITPLGSLIGFAWGFVCGTICGGVLAWLYNVLAASMGTGARA